MARFKPIILFECYLDLCNAAISDQNQENKKEC